MAKLKARHREEIFRVSIARPGSSEGVAEVRDYRAFMSDGNVLSRRTIHYTEAEAAKNYGKKSHDYGWKVQGRAKAGLNLEQFLAGYLNKGWQLESTSPNYFRVDGNNVEAISDSPLISEKAAAKRSSSIEKSRSRAASQREERNGPGFYVTNNYIGSIVRNRIADHEKPFATLEEAIDFAEKRYIRFTREFNFHYLLPVAVLQSASRDLAVLNEGHVWWVDGKLKGPPVAENQTGFNF